MNKASLIFWAALPGVLAGSCVVSLLMFTDIGLKDEADSVVAIKCEQGYFKDATEFTICYQDIYDEYVEVTVKNTLMKTLAEVIPTKPYIEPAARIEIPKTYYDHEVEKLLTKIEILLIKIKSED